MVFESKYDLGKKVFYCSYNCKKGHYEPKKGMIDAIHANIFLDREGGNIYEIGLDTVEEEDIALLWRDLKKLLTKKVASGHYNYKFLAELYGWEKPDIEKKEEAIEIFKPYKL